MDLGKYIRQKRIEKGLTLIEMAMELGYTDSYWSQVERGAIKVLESPSPFLLEDIAHVLDLSYVDLMYRVGYMDSFPRDHRIIMQENEELKLKLKQYET